jgi:hypothetical protein
MHSINAYQKKYKVSFLRNRFILVTFKAYKKLLPASPQSSPKQAYMLTSPLKKPPAEERLFFINIDKLLKELNINYHETIKDYFYKINYENFNGTNLYEDSYNEEMMTYILNIFVEKIKKTIESWFNDDIKVIRSNLRLQSVS